ncbi:MAG: hypothetical protein HXX10_18080 [Rhodoplanes sp.]|uniref:hypothetical protein n=1 Tax=Rhodoplanes sp. TaxID=1968906 RepID=UPI0017A36E69|nr:hypothetical protein [Rhodoplanes sp.]NVO15946.1 hypothetical protein [Rhodoplanes sp.]
MHTQIDSRPLTTPDVNFENSLLGVSALASKMKEKADRITAIDRDALVKLIDAEPVELGDDLSLRALHVLAAGRCGEHWGCRVRTVSVPE